MKSLLNEQWKKDIQVAYDLIVAKQEEPKEKQVINEGSNKVNLQYVLEKIQKQLEDLVSGVRGEYGADDLPIKDFNKVIKPTKAYIKEIKVLKKQFKDDPSFWSKEF